MTIDGVIWALKKIAEYSLVSVSSWDAFFTGIGRAARTFTDLESGMAWPYLLASFTIAAGVFMYARRRGEAKPGTFVSFLFPREVYGHTSAALDYQFYAINLVLKFLFWVPIMTGMGMIGYKAMAAILVEWMKWEPPARLSTGQALGAAFGLFVLYDFVNYCSHVLFHKIPVLWAFHEVHHSAQVMTPITAFRAHPMELLFPALLQMPVIGFAAVFYQNVAPRDLEVDTVFGIGLFTFAFGLLGHHLQHSHIWLSFGPILSRLYISPAQHQIHHSVDARHRNRNFGVKFAIWDTLFGTLYVPPGRETIQLGVPNQKTVVFTSVTRIYFLPFVRVWTSFRGGQAGRI
ncbi:fatty acid hydroxylase [Nitrospira sp. KM1]|uniref:sterol desaturase family protein n=1 Tax=Nitrospira sp. KM1 TaxID=1936990 RepID=UPI0013A74E6E|nr:sterol desaturase family protein [Nitrospira sp. KM1]BCA56842.1 fatty acid hydroxylase [Nitrospira sp. KM1]